jgi:hypothetical protein
MWDRITLDQYLLKHKTAKKSTEMKDAILSFLDSYNYKELFFSLILYDNRMSISISECNDEWYIVKYSDLTRTEWYICDQFDGLMDLINIFKNE